MKIILILGKRLTKLGNITKILKQRLDLGISRYIHGDIFLLSGGNIANVKHTEAYMMKKYIHDKLPNAKTILESTSLSTLENIKNSKKILNDYNCKVLLVTSQNHLKRINKIIPKSDWIFVS